MGGGQIRILEKWSQLIKYGIMSLMMYFGITVGLYLLVETVKLEPLSAYAVVYVFAYLVDYILNLKIIFKTRHSRSTVFKYSLHIVFFYFLNIFLFKFLASIGIQYMLANWINIIGIFPLRFFSYKYVVYRPGTMGEIKNYLRYVSWSTLKQNLKKEVFLFLISTLIVVCVFPEVVFKGASFNNLNIANPLAHLPQDLVFSFKQENRRPGEGLADYGGAAFQSEPIHYFLRNALKTNESPYWNPYQGAGAPGVEGMVEGTFSPLSLLFAVFDGNTNTFHFLMLSFFTFGVFFLLKTLNHIFALSLGASVIGALSFLLNGFHVANLNSNVNLAYLFMPLPLFLGLNFIRGRTVGKYLLFVFSIVPLLACTFIQTTSLILTSLCMFQFVYVFNSKNNRPFFNCFVLLFGYFFALMLSSPIYFPIVEHLLNSEVFSNYASRIYYPENPISLISIMTSKLFWESYNVMGVSESKLGNGTFHYGIVTIICVVFSTFQIRKSLIVFLLGMLVLSLCRIYGIEPISKIVSVLPVFGKINSQYWWAMVSFSVVLLASFGAENIVNFGWRKLRVQAFGAIALKIGLISVLVVKFGFNENSPLMKYQSFEASVGRFYIGIFLLVCFAFYLFYFLSSSHFFKRWALLGIAALSYLELMFYMNHQRYPRFDGIDNPPSYVKFLRENLGDYRIVNYGGLGVFPNLGSAYGIEQIESMGMSISAEYYHFAEKYLMTINDRWTIFISFFKQIDEPNIHPPVLDFLSVKYILVSDDMTKYKSIIESRYKQVFSDLKVSIYENDKVFPKYNLVPSFVLGDLPNSLEGVNLAKTVYISPSNSKGDIEPLFKNLASGHSEEEKSRDESSIKVQERTHTFKKLEVNNLINSFLVVSQTWNRNWSAYVDGVKVSLLKVNDSFSGLYVPKGKHEIILKYRPKSLDLAIFVSLGTFFGLIFAAVFCTIGIRRAQL